jgi:hypothetical protein
MQLGFAHFVTAQAQVMQKILRTLPVRSVHWEMLDRRQGGRASHLVPQHLELRQPLPGSGANIVGSITPDDLRKTIPRRPA